MSLLNTGPEKGSRVSFARVYVEVDAITTLPSMFKVNCEGEKGIVKVEYQGLPPKCDHCVAFGHDTTKCVKTQVAQLISLQKKTDDNSDPGWNIVKANGKRKVGEPVLDPKPPEVQAGVDRVSHEAGQSHPPKPSLGVAEKSLADEIMEVENRETVGESSVPNIEGFDDLQKELVEITKLALPNNAELIMKVENLMGTTPKKSDPTKQQVKQATSTKGNSSGKGYKSQRKKHRNSLSLSKVSLVLLGDFNAIRYGFEKFGGSSVWFIDKEVFNSHILQLKLVDLSYGGCQFTWANKRDSGDYIATKIDSVLVNESWLDSFPASSAYFFFPSCVSDHSPAVVTISAEVVSFKKPFKFFDFWAQHENFIPVVSEVWNQYIQGVPMLRVCQKLRDLKPILKALNKKEFSDVSSRVLATTMEIGQGSWQSYLTKT
ncbi:uncharacterized protein LOC114322842 [Camellia sinensis]|uniref:uncharacterized protein LOC114322842 n=1 Tax=Camellia sinensis TaxID=4442 RepID=UPI001036A8CF|nr:uncharacterized protein LOC114322842 [Camellia sinensis]